jgi:hypothetical protein
MRSAARVASQKAYAMSAKGKAAQARADTKHDERLRAEAKAAWAWTCDFYARKRKYPTREEAAARPK